MIDATHLKAHRTAASLLKRGLFPGSSGERKAADLEAARGLRQRGKAARPVSDCRPGQRFHRGQGAPVDAASGEGAGGGRGYGADRFRDALAERDIETCIPSKSNRRIQIPHDRMLYRRRHRIENMFGKLKDWRRVHTRYDRCAHTSMSAIAIAAIVISWI